MTVSAGCGEKATSARHAEQEAPAMTTTASSTSSLPVEESESQMLKSAHRKIDVRLVLFYSVVYCFMQIHKSNISNVSIINLESGHGIKEELGGLTSDQWAWVLSIFYYPYMCFEPLATMGLRAMTPRLGMSRIMICWGIVSMCQGAVQNYSGLLATRFFLGLAEAGFYPSVLYHLSFYFPAQKLPFRIAVFYGSGMFSGAVSGVLAYAIGFMDQLGGLSGWRWCFIIEGIPAILLGIFAFFFLPDYPETAKFLTQSEKDALLQDLPPKAPTMKAKKIDFGEIKALFRDPTFFTFCVVWISHGVGGFGIHFILPDIIYDLGISDTAISQLLTIPPSAFTLITLLPLAYCTHRGILSTYIAGTILESLQIICYILLVAIPGQPGLKYALNTLATAGGQSFFPIMWPERMRVARGTTTAALAISITNASCQVQGILGPLLYALKFGPHYKTSYCGSIGLLGGTLLGIASSWFIVRRNEKKNMEIFEAEGSQDGEGGQSPGAAGSTGSEKARDEQS